LPRLIDEKLIPPRLSEGDETRPLKEPSPSTPSFLEPKHSAVRESPRRTQALAPFPTVKTPAPLLKQVAPVPRDHEVVEVEEDFASLIGFAIGPRIDEIDVVRAFELAKPSAPVNPSPRHHAVPIDV